MISKNSLRIQCHKQVINSKPSPCKLLGYGTFLMSSISSINAHSLWLLVYSGLAIEHSSTKVHPIQLLPITISIDTKDTHTRCTERVAEAITKIDDSFENVVLYQGDEPLFSPKILKMLANYISNNADRTVTLMDEISEEQAEDLNNPKVVVDLNNYAAFFSRAAIPGSLKGHSEKFFKHIGVVAFKKSLLYEYANMAEGPLERAESIDMLRFIEHSVPIKMLLCESKTIGVDTPKDLEDVEKLMVNDSYYLGYK